MTAYTDKDLERADDWVRVHGGLRLLFGHLCPDPISVAELIATIRRETVEECARACDPDVIGAGGTLRPGLYMAQLRIRALLDTPKAETHRPQVITITPEEAAGVLVARLNKAEPVPMLPDEDPRFGIWAAGDTPQRFNPQPKTEPRCRVCKVCGEGAGNWRHSWNAAAGDFHDFEPEEPGHE